MERTIYYPITEKLLKDRRSLEARFERGLKLLEILDTPPGALTNQRFRLDPSRTEEYLINLQRVLHIKPRLERIVDRVGQKLASVESELDSPTNPQLIKEQLSLTRSLLERARSNEQNLNPINMSFLERIERRLQMLKQSIISPHEHALIAEETINQLGDVTQRYVRFILSPGDKKATKNNIAISAWGEAIFLYTNRVGATLPGIARKEKQLGAKLTWRIEKVDGKNQRVYFFEPLEKQSEESINDKSAISQNEGLEEDQAEVASETSEEVEPNQNTDYVATKEIETDEESTSELTSQSDKRSLELRLPDGRILTGRNAELFKMLRDAKRTKPLISTNDLLRTFYDRSDELNLNRLRGFIGRVQSEIESQFVIELYTPRSEFSVLGYEGYFLDTKLDNRELEAVSNLILENPTLNELRERLTRHNDIPRLTRTEVAKRLYRIMQILVRKRDTVLSVKSPAEEAIINNLTLLENTEVSYRERTSNMTKIDRNISEIFKGLPKEGN